MWAWNMMARAGESAAKAASESAPKKKKKPAR
jgi:NAD(P)H-hydrate repair Nnr-like enzyme with NAD(P)H-hydrate epimerase domain